MTYLDEIVAKMKGAMMLHVEVLEGLERLQALLDDHPKVHSHSVDDGTVRVEFQGGPQDVAQLHRDVVMADVQVTAFYERKEDLEDIFLKVGAHQVS